MVKAFCLVCEKELEILHYSEEYPPEMVSKGVSIRTRGSYGSQVLDCEVFETLFWVCDDCLTSKAKKGLMLNYVMHQVITSKVNYLSNQIGVQKTHPPAEITDEMREAVIEALEAAKLQEEPRVSER